MPPKNLTKNLTKKAIKDALKTFEIDPKNTFYANLYKISSVDYLVTRAAEEIATCTKDNLQQSLEKAIQILVLAKIKQEQANG